MPESALRMSASNAVNCLSEKAETFRIPCSALPLSEVSGDEFLREPQRLGLFAISGVTTVRRLRLRCSWKAMFWFLLMWRVIWGGICDKVIVWIDLVDLILSFHYIFNPNSILNGIFCYFEKIHGIVFWYSRNWQGKCLFYHNPKFSHNSRIFNTFFRLTFLTNSYVRLGLRIG